MSMSKVPWPKVSKSYQMHVSGCKKPPSHMRFFLGLGLGVFKLFSFTSTYFADIDLFAHYMYDVQCHVQ